MHKPTLIVLFLVTGLLSACANQHSAGYGPVRIETYPLDGNCKLNGEGYTMMAKAPADLVVPLSAAPVTVTCETESGYRGTQTLNSEYDPWSPSNVGSLGLGYLVDQTSGSGRRYPEILRLTMVYTEAGKPITRMAPKPTDVEKPPEMAKAEASGDRMAQDRKSMPEKSMPEKSMSEKSMPETSMPDKTMPEKAAMTSGSDDLPAPPAMAVKDASMKDLPMKDSGAQKDVFALKPTKPGSPKDKAGTQAKMQDDVLALKPTHGGAPAPLSGAAAASGGPRVHLASFKDKSNAERNWKTLAQRHRSLLNGLTHSIEAVDLGSKGVFHRVYAGPMKDDNAARALCRAMKKQKAYCRAVAAGAK